MEKYYTQLIGLPVISEIGEPLTRVTDIVVSPENGKVLGIKVLPGSHVIAPIDILALDKAVIIHSHDDILHTGDIFQVREVLKKHIKIYKNKVVTQDGMFLGRVIDFAIHQKLLALTKIVVAKRALGIFYYSKRLINSKDIISIKRDSIIVKNPLAFQPFKKLSIDAATST